MSSITTYFCVLFTFTTVAGAGGRGGSGIEADECLIEGCEGTGGKGGNEGGLDLPDFYQGAMNIEGMHN